MTTELAAEIAGDDLVAEAQRYLAAVEMFRAEGREPSWTAEPRRPRLRHEEHPLERKLCTHRNTT
jgi:hypothetical protein